MIQFCQTSDSFRIEVVEDGNPNQKTEGITKCFVSAISLMTIGYKKKSSCI